MKIKTFNKYLINESLDNIKIRVWSGYSAKTIIATIDGLDIAEFKIDIEDVDNDKFNNIGYIHGLELVDEYRGKGLAKEIFGKMFNYVKDKFGYNRLELDVEESNLPAVRLYRNLGFKNHGYDDDGDLKMIRESFDEKTSYELDRHLFLKNAGVEEYTINEDGSIDVIGDVNLSNKNISRIPYKFNKVGGNFYCGRNKLTSLYGCPEEVTRNFVCSHNKLKSLEYGPIEVGGEYNCRYNEIVTLKGLAAEIGGELNCSNNHLSSLDTVSNIKGDINARENKINNNNNGFMGYCGGEIKTWYEIH